MIDINRIVKFSMAVIISIGLAGLIFWYGLALGKDYGFRSPLFLIWVWFASLGWVVVVLHVFPVNNCLYRNYFNPKRFETNLGLYERLGIRNFKRFMYNGGYVNQLIRRYKPSFKVINDMDSIKRWETVTRSKELGHLIHFLMMLLLSGLVLLLGWYEIFFYMIILNTICNLYPIMVQRYNRFRIARIIHKVTRPIK